MCVCDSGREAPVVELYPDTSQNTQLGGSAYFQCRVTQGIPTPTIQWTRSGVLKSQMSDTLHLGIITLRVKS